MNADEIAAEVAAHAPEPTVFRAVVDGEILGIYDQHLDMLRDMHAHSAPIDFGVGEPV